MRETLKDENDQLRTKLDEEIRRHESTRQELEGNKKEIAPCL